MRRSLLGSAKSGAWLKHFGQFGFSAPNTIEVLSGTAVNDRFHAEVHHDRIIGTDFTHSATITADWIGLDARLVEVFDVENLALAQSRWAFADINTVAWAQAARLATDVYIQRGFAGFFSGHQLPDKRQIVAFRHV